MAFGDVRACGPTSETRRPGARLPPATPTTQLSTARMNVGWRITGERTGASSAHD
jgi:hypothetical protein